MTGSQSSSSESSSRTKTGALNGGDGILSRIRAFIPSAPTQTLSAGAVVATIGLTVGTIAGIAVFVLIYIRSGRRQPQRTGAPPAASSSSSGAAPGGESLAFKGSSSYMAQVSSATAQARTAVGGSNKGGNSGLAV